MSKHLSLSLTELQRQFLSLASRVEEAIGKSLVALRERDDALARQVIDEDDAIDELENRVNEECMRFLLRNQPVATDLRRTAAVLMITADLERMGDLATGVAEQSMALPDWAADAMPVELLRMGELTAAMVRRSLDAYVRLDADAAGKVIRDDREVNRHNDEIIASLTERMKSAPEWVEPGLSLFAVTRHLERIADHATNIAEDVIYLVEGKVMRHHYPGEGTDGPAAGT